MRDLVIAGKPVRAVAGLVERIQQANAGFEVADDAEVELEPEDTRVEEATPSECTIEPDDTVSMVIVDSALADELAEIGRGNDAEASQPEPSAEPEPEPESYNFV